MRFIRSLSRFWLLAFVASSLLAATGVASAATTLTLTSGSAGGGYYQAAAAFAEYIKAEIPGVRTTVIPGGGWANVDRLAPSSKLADVAVLESALAHLAYTGAGPTGKRYSFRMLAAFRGPSIAQAVITRASGIKSFEEIKARKYPIRIVMFERQQLATGQALDILKAYGLTPEEINSWGGKVIFTSLNEGIRMIMDGLADMWFTGSSYYPHAKFIELGTKKAFRLLPVSKPVAEEVAAKYGQRIIRVPANIYKKYNGANQAYWSPATIIDFAVRTGLSDDLVYKMTKALADHKAEFWKVNPQNRFYDPKVAWKDVGGVPLHPGAARYYKEMGYMK